MVKLNRAGVNFCPEDEDHPALWVTTPGLVPYPQAIAAMEAHVDAIRSEGASEIVWLLEHPPLYTAGTSAKAADLLLPDRFPVYQSGRGGQYTYHGPGQRVVYLMLDLARRSRDVRCYVRTIESWVTAALARLGVEAYQREGRTGLWVPRPEKGPLAEDKIAAIGIRVRRWVSFHGVSINVAPDLAHYDGIVACGIRDQGVTSLSELNPKLTMAMLDNTLAATFAHHFGPKAMTESRSILPLASSNLKDTQL